MIDLIETVPGLRGLGGVWAVAAESEQVLAAALGRLGFEVRSVDGAGVRDETSLFGALARALAFPDYFGHNWDALNDCLGDVYDGPPRRLALLWRDADRSFEADAQTVVDAVRAFDAAAVPPLDDPGGERTQLELFLLGRGNGFPRLGS